MTLRLLFDISTSLTVGWPSRGNSAGRARARQMGDEQRPKLPICVFRRELANLSRGAPNTFERRVEWIGHVGNDGNEKPVGYPNR